MPRATTHEERVKLMHHAESMVESRLTQMKRLLTSLSLWQRRQKYYAAQAAKTDEEIAQDRQRAADARQRRAQTVRRIRV